MNRTAARARTLRRAPRRVAGSRGFTLIEVLLATVLLAAGLALAFATLAAATQTATRGEAMAHRAERMRMVESFLRRRIAGARAVPFAFDQAAAQPQRFVGEPDRMRFVADLPDYLGRGGPYLHDFVIEGDGDRARIELSLSMVLAGEVVEEREQQKPEVLVGGLREARFRYRAMNSVDGKLGEWQDRWETAEFLPLFVEVTLTDVDGLEWPPLIVSLPLAGNAFGGGIAPMGVRQ